ncbi:NADH-ubiquinone oxidoreductase 10 subunit [Beauveria bassiana]|uniref:NADH-ubiquinone oxidoreductase 10 subunit n=1 Tax=Beauveria bassiana TaxID=176275 RepID=A0A2N6NM83_BEABA|nr:NADH-ubiquinone oxidoreductase 10 subunit [Beauveria bassiana]
MSGKYTFAKSLKELRFLFCQTSEASAPVRAIGTAREDGGGCVAGYARGQFFDIPSRLLGAPRALEQSRRVPLCFLLAFV